MKNYVIDYLAHFLKEEELPGRKAQLAFANHAPQDIPENIGDLLKISEDAIPAATLCLLFPQENGSERLSFALIKRTKTVPDDPHSGQISFPGGRMEISDPSLKFTAVRETKEEIGINPKDIQVLGRLSDLFISVSNHLVSPYVGYMEYRPEFILQKSEVRHIFTPCITELLNPDNILHQDITVRNTTLKNMPYFKLSQEVVWGATAMILSEFKMILKDIK